LRSSAQSGTIWQVEDVEYRPPRGVGLPALIRAVVATAAAVLVFSLGAQARAAAYLAPFPAVLAVAWWASYAVHRRRRCRLTATGIESRRLRTRVISWAEIREVEVVERVTVARLAVRGNRAAGGWGGRPGGGARKVAAVKVRQASGRWRELAMPVVWENAPDPEFAAKAAAIRDRWQAATGCAPVGSALT
jgi:hypothetical protein